jgi:riboflavin synthase
MFTGIVETAAKILASENGLTVERPTAFDDLRIGSSVAVAGVCLSVVELTADALRFDVMGETLKRTSLGDKKAGDMVNLERSLAANGRFEGHVVQGHVEGTGTVTELAQDGKWTLLRFTLPADLASLVVQKGAIAVDGVSLTVADLRDDVCTIALIPHTLAVTTLGSLRSGDRVNIETDILGRYVRSLLWQSHSFSLKP